MAKIYGLFGPMKGKVADVVMAVRSGEQIVRKYQPIVSNPSTSAQVAARAKLKLMSQLSAVMAPVIAIARQGIVSSRNMFVKTNYGNATYANNTADIPLTSIKLTRSVVSLPDLIVTRQTGNSVSVSVFGGDQLSRVVFAAFAKQPDGTLTLSDTKVVSVPESAGTFSALLTVFRTYEGVVYAYGVRDNTDAARARFGDMQAITAETVAKLIVTRVLTEADVTLTETKAAVIPAGTQQNAAPAPEEEGEMRSEKKK